MEQFVQEFVRDNTHTTCIAVPAYLTGCSPYPAHKLVTCTIHGPFPGGSAFFFLMQEAMVDYTNSVLMPHPKTEKAASILACQARLAKSNFENLVVVCHIITTDNELRKVACLKAFGICKFCAIHGSS
jgi:hypothetical protein